MVDDYFPPKLQLLKSVLQKLQLQKVPKNVADENGSSNVVDKHSSQKTNLPNLVPKKCRCIKLVPKHFGAAKIVPETYDSCKKSEKCRYKISSQKYGL